MSLAVSERGNQQGARRNDENKTKRTLEQIRLVHEQDDARLSEPPRVGNALEETGRLVHAVNVRVFVERLVVFGDGDEEDEHVHVLEAVDPLLALRPLSSHVEHDIVELPDLEPLLGETGRLDTRTQNVLVCRDVVLSTYPFSRVEVASGGRGTFSCAREDKQRKGRLTRTPNRSTGTRDSC
jgi:hypothetical protein